MNKALLKTAESTENKDDLKKIKWWKKLAVLLFLSFLFAFVAYNSLNIVKYDSEYEELMPDGVIEHQANKDSEYKVDANLKSYLNYHIKEKEIRVIYIMLLNPLEREANIKADLFYKGYKVKTVSTVLGKDTIEGQLFLDNILIDNIQLYIDKDCSIDYVSMSYLCQAPQETRNMLKKGILAMLFLLVILSMLISMTTMGDRLIGASYQRMQQFIIALYKHEKEHHKELLDKALHLVAFIIVGNFLFVLLYKFIFKQSWQSIQEAVLFGSMIGILGFIMFSYLKNKNFKFEKMFLSCGIVIGVVFSIILPLHLNISWDDQIHYQNSSILSYWMFSHQICTSVSESDYYFSCFSNQLKEYADSNNSEWIEILNNNKTIHAAAGAAASVSYTWIVYLPIAIAFFILRGLYIPTSICVILGRAAGVIFYLLIIYQGMKHLKSGKLIMATVALMPGVMFIVTNYNYDYWLISLIMYSMAYLIGEYQYPEKLITFRDISLIFGSFFIGIIVKPVYIPLLALAAFLPKQKFKNKKLFYAYRGCFLGAVIGVIILFSFILFKTDLGVGDIRGGIEVNATAQAQYILNNPVQYAKVLMKYMKDYLSLSALKSYIISTAYIPSKMWLGLPCIILLLIATVIDRDQKEKINWHIKLLILPLAFVTACCVATAMYVMFTPVGADGIAGCQGRYLWPIVFPVFIVLSRVRILAFPNLENVRKYLEAITLITDMALTGIMMTVFI